MLLWTINDFLAYINLVGYTIRRYNTCPYCGLDTSKCRRKDNLKNAYLVYHRWLPSNHEFRDQKKAFNNKVERSISETIEW